MELTEIHAILRQAFTALVAMQGRADRCSPDTAFAIGSALGTIAKAAALVGRDIDTMPTPP
jgi:hypothetical protein